MIFKNVPLFSTLLFLSGKTRIGTNPNLKESSLRMESIHSLGTQQTIPCQSDGRGLLMGYGVVLFQGELVTDGQLTASIDEIFVFHDLGSACVEAKV